MQRPTCRIAFAIAVVAACLTPGLAAAQDLRDAGAARGSRPASAERLRIAKLAAAIADIEAGRLTTPLIGEPGTDGGTIVTFLATRGGGRIPRIVSDVTGWGERPDDTFDFTAGTMTRVGRTDWYSLDVAVAPRARIEYLVVHGLRDYRLDPHNPRQRPHAGGSPASEFVMSGYLPPQEFEDPPAAPAGRVAEATIECRALGGSRRVIVYTPPDYREDGDYPVAVFHGGLSVVSPGEAPRVLDFLIARQAIEPIVAVFVDSWPHDNDAGTAASTRAFLTDELLTWVASRYGVTRSAGRRAILGISFGAKDALDAALAPTETFGRVGLLIPGRRLTRADIDSFAARRDRRLRVTILAGQYDGPNLPTARRAQQTLAEAGHAVDYIEVPEGHNQATWRNHLRDVLVSLFGTTARQKDATTAASGVGLRGQIRRSAGRIRRSADLTPDAAAR
jgi:enterochelin esterase-like enzyme